MRNRVSGRSWGERWSLHCSLEACGIAQGVEDTAGIVPCRIRSYKNTKQAVDLPHLGFDGHARSLVREMGDEILSVGVVGESTQLHHITAGLLPDGNRRGRRCV